MRRHAVIVSVVFVGLFVANQAQAYIGPGAGLSAIGSALALVGALVLMLVGFVWYPVKRLMKRRKETAPSSGERKRDRKASEQEESKTNREPDSSRSGSSS